VRAIIKEIQASGVTRTAAGEALAISVPAGETRVLKHFQKRMPYGLSCQTLLEEYPTAPGVFPTESSH
jgi:hypothetical protein